MSSAVLIALMQLLETGMKMREVVAKAQTMEAAGASATEVSAWIVSERDAKLLALQNAPRK